MARKDTPGQANLGIAGLAPSDHPGPPPCVNAQTLAGIPHILQIAPWIELFQWTGDGDSPANPISAKVEDAARQRISQPTSKKRKSN
jgi:hypothetical protein